MDRAAILGLLWGAGAGGLYAWWQLRSLGRAARNGQSGSLTGWARPMAAAAARVAFLVVALGASLALPAAMLNKWWMAGGLVFFYSLPFFWRLRQMVSRSR